MHGLSVEQSSGLWGNLLGISHGGQRWGSLRESTWGLRGIKGSCRVNALQSSLGLCCGYVLALRLWSAAPAAGRGFLLSCSELCPESREGCQSRVNAVWGFWEKHFLGSDNLLCLSGVWVSWSGWTTQAFGGLYPYALMCKAWAPALFLSLVLSKQILALHDVLWGL